MSLSNIHLTALILRVGFGLNIVIGHGWGKFNRLISGEEINFPDVMGLPPTLGLSLAVLAEFVACLFIILGYKTKWAAVPVIITMAVAAFVIHSGDPWFGKGGSKEMAVLYLVGFLAIFFTGSGKYSVDGRISGAY